MDADRIQDLILRHFEKLILAFVLVASGFLIYRGLQQEDILETHQPEWLTEEARRAKGEVDEDHNDIVLADRKVELMIPSERPPIHGGGPLDRIWDPPLVPDFNAHRQDPLLPPPMAIQVHGVIAPLAVRSDTGQYAIKDLEPAEPIKTQKKVIRRSNQRRPRPADAELDDLYGELGIEDLDQPILDDAAPAERRLRNPIGARPVATRHIKANTPQVPVPGVGWFIAGTAVMPYQQLHESYELALGLGKGYAPDGRDQPTFKDFHVQRADVTHKSIDQLVEADWIKRDGRVETIRDAVLIWAGFAPEIVPADYRADGTLTMWIPPVMLSDYSLFSLHPLIPMESLQEIAERKARQQKLNVPVRLQPENIVVRDSRTRNRRGHSNPLFNEQRIVREIAAHRQPVHGLPKYKLIRFYDFANDDRDPNAPEFGRKYVYRIRVAVEDPNFPANPALQPPGSSLDPIVYQRVKKMMANIENADDPWRQRATESRRWTNWSLPSEAVSLPSKVAVAIGPARADRVRQVEVGTRMVDHQRKPTRFDVVVTQFDEDLKMNVPTLMTGLTEGAVLNKKSEAAEVVDPITLKVKKAQPVDIESRVTVIDFDGGIPLQIHKEDGLVSPGLMLTFGEDGGLKVHEEVDDLERFRIESFADERGE